MKIKFTDDKNSFWIAVGLALIAIFSLMAYVLIKSNNG